MVFQKISEILKESKISYIKWDMNRLMTEMWSEVLNYENQGEVAHGYILGLYSLLERITKEFLDILFELCTRKGMLYYIPQTWTSDNTDPMDRIKIQYGTSMYVIPFGAHVSASPNHQTGRITSIETKSKRTNRILKKIENFYKKENFIE